CSFDALTDCVLANRPDGTSCAPAACGAPVVCAAGACACMSPAVAPFQRPLPSGGCALASGTGDWPAAIALVLALLAARRRRLWLALLAGCGGGSTALEV